MRDKLDKLVRPLIERTIEALWAQWAAVGPIAARSGLTAHSIVDPEALVLGSLSLAPYERRLANSVNWWAMTGTTVMSVQRMKNLVTAYPQTTRELLANFASTAFESGDVRWRVLAGKGRVLRAREKDLSAAPVLSGDPALLLRLRRGLGVGIKSDVIAFLMMGAPQTVPAIARWTGYHTRAVRRAVDDLVAAGFVSSAPTSPATFRVDPDSWRALLQFGQDPPLWRPWYLVYSVVAQIVSWAEEQRETWTGYVLGSRARDLVEAIRPRLASVVNLAEPKKSGEDYIEEFGRTLGELSDFMSLV